MSLLLLYMHHLLALLKALLKLLARDAVLKVAGAFQIEIKPVKIGEILNIWHVRGVFPPKLYR